MHVWRAAGGETPQVTTLVPPQTDVPIDAAREVMGSAGIDRAVLVQPMFRGEDNSYVADCARDQPERFAAVCVVDPRAPGAEDRLAHWVERGCRGLRLRPLVPAEADAFASPATYPLWHAAETLRVTVSILCTAEHLATVDALAERFPAVPIIIDHLAWPATTPRGDAAQNRDILSLARHPRVFVKLSGYYHFSAERFPYRDCWDLTRAVYDRFGPRRLLWGSDFPHVTVTCGYAPSLDLLDQIFPGWPPADRDAVLGANALELYWGPTPRAPP
jgi:predicted TIM-barrel fold metal-dependent hydrolase